jgi:hypothetical protein
MGSDRARVSFDRKQQYRTVVMQQGRVTLESDWNEAQQITQEEMRSEARDFVGPAGTPDNGYQVLPSTEPTTPAFDFSVEGGTMYVGGMRVHHAGSIDYGNQSDWRDYGPQDPDWVDFTTLAAAPPADEFVYLSLREQEISAVEDGDLKDVALGGPDTAQRTCLLQRIVRVACNGTDCGSGLAAAKAKWQSEGLYFDSKTMRLNAWSTLRVGFSGQVQTQNPCQPQAQGGYVGPDNQLIRVQISGLDPTTQDPMILWGFDDASFLYQIQVDAGNPQQLDFQTIPVDAQHQPVGGQAVEVLRTAAELSNGANVAATTGFAFTLTQNYDPDSQSIQLPSGVSLPADYLNSSQSPPPPPQLYLRVWQNEITCTPGQAYPLGNTGLTVTLQSINHQPFHAGDYWLFAVRTATPQIVYPQRYQNGFQPPDGPRLWACPLGVIAWSGEIATLASDCRNQFCNLVASCQKPAQGCCTVTVQPEDLDANTTLQSIVTEASNLTMLVQAVTAGTAGNNISVAISNVQLNANPPVFDLTVSETDIYTDLTTGTIEGLIGDEEGGPNTGLAHILTGSVNTKLNPLGNQTVALSGGAAQSPAQVNVMDPNSNVVFTLQAKGAGADGNLTQATVSALNTSQNPPTFNLTLTWSKTLPGVSLANLFSSISASLSYEIVASPPATGVPAFPMPGVTSLVGGVNAIPPIQALTAQAMIFGAPSSVCLKPGSYPLSAPLIFGPELSNITLEACGGPATLSVAAGAENNFAQGMIQVNGASGIVLNGLVLEMPQIILYQSGATLGGLSSNTLASIGEAELVDIVASVAMTVVEGQDLIIRNCTFNYPALQTSESEILLAFGLLVSGDSSGIRLERNSFLGPVSLSTLNDSTGTNISGALTCGFLQSDGIQFTGSESGAAQAGVYTPSSLDNLFIANNTFENLTFPVLIASVLGLATFDGNIVTSCFTGFTVFPLYALSQATGNVVEGVNQTSLAVTRTVAGNSSLQQMVSVAAAYPRPKALVPSKSIVISQSAIPTAAPAAGAKPAAPAAGAKRAAPAAKAKPAAAEAAEKVIVDPSTYRPITARATSLIGQVPIDFFELLQIPFQVRFTNNQVQAQLTGGGSAWALAILSFTEESTTLGLMTMVGNQFTNSSTIFTALVMVDVCAATGNVILNARGRDVGKGLNSASLIITNFAVTTNTADAAVTGNVLEGPATLPTRSGGLPAWTTYNTII